MLVLGRKPGEYVVIDDQIIVKVVKGPGGQLRLAIDAPKSVSIVRGEAIEEKKEMIEGLVLVPQKKEVRSNKTDLVS